MYLLIGYGNPLRGDDGLGLYLAEMLGTACDVITPTQLTPELAVPISQAERVVFIDARIGESPGEVICDMVKPLYLPRAFTHHVTPASLLAAAQELYAAAPEAILITVTGAAFDYGCTFSPQIHIHLAQVVSRVEAIIRVFFGIQVESAR